MAALASVAYAAWRQYQQRPGSERPRGWWRRTGVGPRPMIAALERLRAAQPAALPDALGAFGIAGGGRLRWFSTHPSLEERIDALRRLA